MNYKLSFTTSSCYFLQLKQKLTMQQNEGQHSELEPGFMKAKLNAGEKKKI